MLALTSCQDEVKQLHFTDKGPEMTVDSYSTDVYMGADIYFQVSLSDREYDLSTVKAELYFDESKVSNVTLRTKTEGTYEGKINCPLYAKIPDGTASLVFIGQNVGMGITTDTVDVNVKRPDFDKLTLEADGKTWEMAKTGDYVYTVVGDFPAALNAKISTPAVNEKGDIIKLGWSGSAVEVSEKEFPFTMKTAGKYEVSVDLWELTASPFGKITAGITESSPVAVVNVVQGAVIDFPGIEEVYTWQLDYDFFNLEEDNTITFKPISGLYRMAADYTNKFIRVDMMANENDYARMNLENPSASAIYAIGDGIGKPSKAFGASWNTTEGAWCLAQWQENIYQITFIAGSNCNTSGLNWKVFENRGWDGNFQYASVESDDLVEISKDGNIVSGTKPLEAGVGYTFKFDLTGGANAVKLSVVEANIPVSALEIKVNDVQAKKISPTHYQVPSVDLTQNGALNISLPEGYSLDGWYLDPDYLSLDDSGLKFAAMGGKYSVDLYLDKKFALFKKVNADGKNGTFADDSAVWLMAWGVAAHIYTEPNMEGGQLAWEPGTAFCMAEVAPKVYRFTGIAVAETDEVTVGGRFRNDYLSFKYFGQDGWGAEKGKMFDGNTATNVVYTERAAKLIKGEAGNNIELVNVENPLELGATYVFEIDLSVAGTETIDFYKK